MMLYTILSKSFTSKLISSSVKNGNYRYFTTSPFPYGNPIPSRKEFLHDFLSLIRSKEQLDLYKRTYGMVGLNRLAVIKIGGEIIAKQLPLLCDSLRFLKDAGLFPIVVHGVGPQMNNELEKRKIEPEYYGGMRITNEITLQLARNLFLEANTKLLNALKNSEIPSRSLTTGVFTAEFKDKKKLGYVGEITNVTCDHVYSAIHANEIPILTTLGETLNGQILNINADVAARKLAVELKPFKTIFINSKGGWIEDDGTKLKSIVMSEDYKRLASRDYTGRQGTLLKLNEIKLLLDSLPRTSSVVLTSAAGLKHEILDASSSTGTVCVYESGARSIGQGHIHTNLNKGKRKVAVLGARGYVGRELLRLIGRHSELELVCASSQGNEGSKVIDVTLSPPLNAHTKKPVASVDYSEHLSIDPEMGFTNLNPQNILSWDRREDVDVWILALPNGVGQQYVDSIMKIKNGKTGSTGLIIDVSADQRFNNDWVYGLPETPNVREKLRNAKLISNPGCYATASQIGLLPLLKSNELSRTKRFKISLHTNSIPHVFGVSGYSGAGTGPSLANNPEFLQNNIIAYKSLNHIHEKEITRHLNHPVNFHPHVGPFFQGIHVTLSMKLANRIQDANEVKTLYEKFYDGERLVRVADSIPFVKDNARGDHVTVGGFQIDEETGRLVVISTIDNLRKGAATQAIQNMNIALGMDEYAGIC